MKWFVLSLLAFTPHAFALGPIPNGTYEGKLSCRSSRDAMPESQETIVVGDDSMDYSSAEGKFQERFVATDGRNFRVNPEKENGSGYFTDDGLFFRIAIGGFTGEDRYRFLDNKLYLLGSVVVGKDMYLCSAIFERK